MNSLLWMLDAGTDAGTDLTANANLLWAEVWEIVSIAIWVLVALLAVVFIVKAVMTAMAVMKAADEPQVRQEKIAGFKYLALGLGIAIVVLSLTNVLVPMIMRFGNQDSALGDVSSGIK